MVYKKKFVIFKKKKIYFLFKKGIENFLFIHGIGGCKEHFFNCKDFLNNRTGVLSLDLPGFGESLRKGSAPKNIAKHHVEVIDYIVNHLNLKNLNIVFFSLSTCYIKIIKKYKFFSKISKIILIEPTILTSDLDWSKKIYSLNEMNFNKYMYSFKRKYHMLVQIIFPELDIKYKNKFIKSIKNMNIKYLRALIKEGVHQVKNNDIKNIINNISKKFLVFYSENNSLARVKFKNERVEFVKIKSKYHYIMIDDPKKIYKKIFN